MPHPRLARQVAGRSIVIRYIRFQNPLAAPRREHHQPAIVARKHNPIIREFSARLSDRKLPKMAIVAAAMRKLLHLIDAV